MGYVEDSLLQGESVIYQTRLHSIIYSRAILVAALAIAILLLGFSTASPVARAGGGSLLFIAVILGIRAALIRSGGEFAVTNKRILLKVGNLRRRSVELMLSKVESVTVDQPLFGRMLNYGSVIIRGTGGTHERFDLIASPSDFRRQALQQVEERTAPPASA